MMTKKAKSAAGRATRKAAAPEPATVTSHKFTWLDGEKHGTEWISKETPPGEIAPARIRMSGRNRDGSYSYFCYRDATAVAVKHDLKLAKAACEQGKSPRLSDSVIAYVEKHPNEIPPFLLLTDGERRAVRGQYPYAPPPARALGRALDAERGASLRAAANPQDPGTVRLLKELAARESAAGSGQRSTRAAKKDALSDPSARLLAVPGITNPAKAGTKRHAGYQLLLDCAKRGASVREYLDAGGKDLRLAKAVRNGLVELKKGEK